MNKKLVAITSALALTLAMGTTAFAATPDTAAATAPQTQISQSQNQGCGGRGMMSGSGYGFMMDEDGNLLDQKDFEAKLDKAVKDGTIKTEDKDFYLRMYENCASGNGNGGMMRGCGRN